MHIKMRYNYLMLNHVIVLYCPNTQRSKWVVFLLYMYLGLAKDNLYINYLMSIVGVILPHVYRRLFHILIIYELLDLRNKYVAWD